MNIEKEFDCEIEDSAPQTFADSRKNYAELLERKALENAQGDVTAIGIFTANRTADVKCELLLPTFIVLQDAMAEALERTAALIREETAKDIEKKMKEKLA